MRGLIILILVVSFAWAGYWFTGSTAQKAAFEGWMEQQRAVGWVAEAGDLTVNGFPNRFDTVLTDLELGNPAAGWNWKAPSFQMLALSYKPNHIIAVWPGEHIITTATDTITLSSEQMRGSVILAPDTTLALARVQLEISDLTAKGANDWDASLETASVAFFALPTKDSADSQYNLFVQATEVTPPSDWLEAIVIDTQLPASIPEILIDAGLTFDAPWNRFAVEQSTPRLTAMNIRDARFIWGALELHGAGDLTINADGFAEGNFTIQARNWRDLLQVMQAAEVLNAETVNALEKGLNLLANAAGNPETIEVPLRFANNKTYIGFIPLAPAPQFYR